MAMRRSSKSLIALGLTTALTLTACGSDADNSTTDSTSDTAQSDQETSNDVDGAGGAKTVTDISGNEVVIPADIDSIVVTDNRSFQIVDDWGIELTAAPLELMAEQVVSYPTNPDIVNLGNHREPNLEGIVQVQPDLVINGQRFADHAEEIKGLLPEGAAFVDINKPDDMPLDEYYVEATTLLGEIFDEQDKAEKLISNFEDAIERGKQEYDPSQTVMGLVTSGGSINYAAPGTGRSVGPVFDLLDLTPSMDREGSTNHQGDDISVEAIAETNPDWLLVLDRDQAAASEGEEYTPSAELITNSEALAKVNAVVNDHIVYTPDYFYQHEDIILYTDYLNEIADAFISARGDGQ